MQRLGKGIVEMTFLGLLILFWIMLHTDLVEVFQPAGTLFGQRKRPISLSGT